MAQVATHHIEKPTLAVSNPGAASRRRRERTPPVPTEGSHDDEGLGAQPLLFREP